MKNLLIFLFFVCAFSIARCASDTILLEDLKDGSSKYFKSRCSVGGIPDPTTPSFNIEQYTEDFPSPAGTAEGYFFKNDGKKSCSQSIYVPNYNDFLLTIKYFVISAESAKEDLGVTIKSDNKNEDLIINLKQSGQWEVEQIPAINMMDFTMQLSVSSKASVAIDYIQVEKLDCKCA